MERVIGEFGSDCSGGVLVVVFAAVHGNEPAGVAALQAVFNWLEKTATEQPDFVFQGKLMGLMGNCQAFAGQQRFLERDLNRQWTRANLERIRHSPRALLKAEDLEMAELLNCLHEALQAAQPETLVLLDLHTTSAQGGIFCIPADDAPSLHLAKALCAPVILGMLEGIEGTLLHFGAENHFQMDGHPKHTLGVAFEAGQHDDPLSIARAMAAVFNCLQTCGCLDAGWVDQQYDALLQSYAATLPKVTCIRHVHHIRPGDQFRMRAGYVNFQAIQKGEHLADDVSGPILSPQDGLILMPLYQPKGSDGFFVAEICGEDFQ